MAKSQLQKFKEEVVRAIREDFQGDYDLCEEGVKSFFEALGLTEIDEALRKTVTITFPISGYVNADDIKAYVQGWDFKYGASLPETLTKVEVVIQ